MLKYSLFWSKDVEAFLRSVLKCHEAFHGFYVFLFTNWKSKPRDIVHIHCFSLVDTQYKLFNGNSYFSSH